MSEEIDKYKGLSEMEREVIDLVGPLIEYMTEINEEYMRFVFPQGVLVGNPPLRKLISLFSQVAIGLDGYNQRGKTGGVRPGDAATYTLYWKNIKPASGALGRLKEF
ncbi:hypothetical protein [Larkinella terrae]|uniref:Uncharacterized protein n=1 Tax=Larkinella terrae TaxID=2025311 RepID=A0A7K0EJ07_9BACT|nr:hypothetical protein [Larkinella terrae]MRS61774.1 hypothetical protein [Larkinella terrae]